jgi:hypothetical protein
MERLGVLTNGEKMFVGSGLWLALASLFPWFTYSVGDVSIPMRPWDIHPLAVFPILFGLAAAGLILVLRLGNFPPQFFNAVRTPLLVVAGISDAALGILAKSFIDDPNVSINFGFWLALPAGLLLFYGIWVLQDEGH